MKSSDRFAGAVSSYENSRYTILGVPFDKTSSFRAGAEKAPDGIRGESYCFESYLPEYDISLTDIPIHDAGDIEEVKEVEEMGGVLQKRVKGYLEDDKFPILMGGEHTLTPFAISSYDDISVLVLDGHMDFRDSYEGKRWSHATVCRRVLEQENVEALSVVGVRSISQEVLWEFEEEGKPEGFYHHKAEDIDDIDALSDEVKGELEIDRTDRDVYLSVDMDVLDPSYAPGVGNPEPFGLTPVEVKRMISRLAPDLVGMDIVEVCPKYDPSSRTLLLAARLINEFLGAKES